jgi:dTDP-4-amino-4,6-dideoxygalactose transaminase
MSEPVARIRVPVFEGQLENVVAAIRAGQLARGPHLGRLEAELCAMFGKRHALLTSNGFAALFATLKALGPADAPVLTAAAGTCFAMVNAIKAAGREVAFADLDAGSFGIGDLRGLQAGGRLAAAVVPDHFGRIAPACRRPLADGALLVEDAAQAFLSRRRIGTAADVVVLSFYPTKFANGIDGGAVLTDLTDLHQTMRHLASYEEQHEFEPAARFNLGMSNLHAAFALGTLAEIEGIERRLLDSHAVLRAVATDCGLRVAEPGAGEVPSRFIVECTDRAARDRMLAQLEHCGVQASRELVWLCPAEERGRHPVAARLVDCTLSLPFHPLLSDREVERIGAALRSLR